MKKQLLSVLAAMALVCAGGAYAADDVIFSDGAARISDIAAKNTAVSVTVLKGGVTPEKFNSSANPTELCVGYRQTVTDAEGKFTVDFDIGTKSGKYEVYFGSKDAEVKHSSIRYVNKTENEAAISKLAAIFDKAEDERPVDFALLLSSDADALGLDGALVNTADKADAAKIFFASVTKDKVTDYASAMRTIEKALAIECINGGKATFTAAADKLNLPQSVAKYLQKDFFDDTAKAYIDSKMKSAIDFDSFDKAAAETVCLGVIRHADGTGYVRESLIDNAELLGIDSARVTDKFAQSIIGKDYESIAATGVNTWVDPVTPTPSGGGGSGGKGGSSGGGSLSNITVDGGTVAPSPIDRTPAAFADMAGFEWAAAAVDSLRTQSIVSGKADGIFAPADSVLREEFVKMLLGGIRFEELYGSISFADVSADDWFEPYVRKAYLAGIVKGISDDKFGVGGRISRQDMAVMCYNALVKKGVMTDSGEVSLGYADADRISDYAAKAVSALAAAGIVRGDENGFFKPTESAMRAEAAQMIYNTMNYAGR